MRLGMKKLLHHLQSGNYSSEDVCCVLETITKYSRAVTDFQKSTTPESEALARWRLDDIRKEWINIRRIYDLPMIELELII